MVPSNPAKVSGQAWGLQSQRRPVLSTRQGGTWGRRSVQPQTPTVGREEPARDGAHLGVGRCLLLLGARSLVAEQAARPLHTQPSRLLSPGTLRTHL